MEGVSLIDVASEDDLLIAAGSPLTMPSPGLSGMRELYNCDGLETDVQQRENLLRICKRIEQVPELSKSPEQMPGKSGKFNMRKSLAWDSAFFTSEGVLNAEELSIVNGTFGKIETCTLPRIQEDLRKSTESASTLDSESWALEDLEVDLFENLRASIKKSLGKGDKASYNRKDQRELTASRCVSSKKIESSSQNKMKPNTVLRRHVLVKQRPEATMAESHIHVKMNAGVTGVPKLSLKPPRIAPRAIALSAIPGKKASVSGTVQTKSNTVKSLSGNAARRQSAAVPLKKSVDSSSVTPRSIPSPKSTFGSHPSNEVSSISSSSNSSHKSRVEYSRKKSTSSTYHPCEPATKALVRPSKSRIGTKNPNSPTTCLKTLINPSSSVSPNSSVNSVVSESSSSNSVSMVKPNNLTENFDAGTCSSPSLHVTLGNSKPHPSNLNKLSNGRGSRTGTSGKLSQGPASTGAKCFKPSGLRMPTPKIGYFDAEKSFVHGSNKISQYGLQSNLPKDNTVKSNTAGTKKLKPGTLPSVKSAAQSTTANSNSPYTQATRLSSIRGSKPASTLMTLHRLSKSAELHDTPIITKDHTLCSKTNMDLSPITRKDGHTKIFVRGICDTNELSQLSNLSEKQVSQLNSRPMTTKQDANGSAFSGQGNLNDSNATEACLEYKKEGTMVNELHSAPQVIQKENLFSTESTGGLEELIG